MSVCMLININIKKSHLNKKETFEHKKSTIYGKINTFGASPFYLSLLQRVGGNWLYIHVSFGANRSP